jgi:RNA polymerase sigma-70 factor (ECF subfamily)
MNDERGAALRERVAQACASEERFLWGLCYRMTGSAAEADDLTQDAFLRALERPPADLDRPLGPWLARVASRLALDALRARRARRTDLGCFLPEPIPAAESDAGWDPASARPGPEARYALAESASFAFLVALEALTPKQRAVVLLRDVLGYRVEETARFLATSSGGVKTTHYRARAALERYDRRRASSRPAAAQRRALAALFEAVLGDAPPDVVAALFSEDVRSISDGGDGEVSSARRVIVGPTDVARLVVGLARRAGGGVRARPVVANGEPAVLAVYPAARGRRAPTSLVRVDVDPGTGAITDLHTVLDPSKLTRLTDVLAGR